MLQLKNNLLKSSLKPIESSDYSFELQSDIDCLMFGIIILNNNVHKTIQFTKINSTYKARWIITKDIIPYLQGATFKLSCASSAFSRYTNEIPLQFNIAKINLDVKIKVSKDIEQLNLQLAMMDERLSSLMKTGVIPAINIVNKELMKPGMIPVVLDNKGNFALAYPFVDIISEVNGQRAVDGVVNINASMIKYNTERSIVDQFKVMTDALQKTNESIKLLSEQIKTINNNVKQLRFDLDTHLDNGI